MMEVQFVHNKFPSVNWLMNKAQQLSKYLQMISSLLAPFHRIMSSGSTQKGRQTIDTTHQARQDNVDYTIPDGNPG
jgi:hypothetical protein